MTIWRHSLLMLNTHNQNLKERTKHIIRMTQWIAIFFNYRFTNNPPPPTHTHTHSHTKKKSQSHVFYFRDYLNSFGSRRLSTINFCHFCTNVRVYVTHGYGHNLGKNLVNRTKEKMLNYTRKFQEKILKCNR